MEGEIAFLRRAITPPDRTKKGCVIGTIGSKSVMLVRSGVGPENTARRLADATNDFEPECVLSIGCAGALRPGIGVGDVVVSGRIVSASAEAAAETEEYSPTPELIAIAKARCDELGYRFHSGTTVSTPTVAATARAKEELASKYGAVAVDMETAQVAAWAQKMGADMLAVRTISDTASHRIPPEIGTILDNKRRLRPLKAISVFAAKPGLLVETIRLKRNLDRSLKALSEVVTALLERI